MPDNFKTDGDALKFCEKYGASTHQQRPWNIFQIAEALLRAYQDGAANQPLDADTKSRVPKSVRHVE